MALEEVALEMALEMALASLTYDMEVAERALDAQVDAAQADAAVALQAAARGHATRRRQLLRRTDDATWQARARRSRTRRLRT